MSGIRLKFGLMCYVHEGGERQKSSQNVMKNGLTGVTGV